MALSHMWDHEIRGETIWCKNGGIILLIWKCLYLLGWSPKRNKNRKWRVKNCEEGEYEQISGRGSTKYFQIPLHPPAESNPHKWGTEQSNAYDILLSRGQAVYLPNLVLAEWNIMSWWQLFLNPGACVLFYQGFYFYYCQLIWQSEGSCSAWFIFKRSHKT